MTVSQSPNSNEPNSKQSQDPAQRDAERVRRIYPASFILKLLGLLLILFAVMMIIFYIMAGTARGTKFLVEKVIAETGVKIEYSHGNLRDGLLLKDVALKASEDIDVHLINAYVKIGWRAIFTREVHLRDANIDAIEIVNHKPATKEPFDYKTLELPVNLRFDRATIDSIVYNQNGEEPIVISNVLATDLSWVGTQVKVDNATIKYNDNLDITKVTGVIELKDNYPLNASATINMKELTDAYIEPIAVQATGSLKRTYGTLKSKYNGSNVSGTFTVQGLDDNSPFDAKIKWHELTLPYAEQQNITLQNGLMVASGVLSDIDIRINSRLLAENIPSGQYSGRAKLVDSKLLIDRLATQTEQGRLMLQGVVDWQNDVTVALMANGSNYKVRSFLPSDYAAYAPETLNGQLAFIYRDKNKDGLMQINADLLQRDGEHINAKLIEGQKPENPRFEAPWFINASWQNIRRKDVPDIGDINSPRGTANVTLRDDHIWVNTDARINQLSVAPEGSYQIKLHNYNDRVDIRSLNYNGVVGELKGTGSILLANKNRPLTWDIDAHTNGLLPQGYDEDLPVTLIVGDVNANGKIIDVTRITEGKVRKGQRHIFTINSSDLTTTLTAQVEQNSPQTINRQKSENRQVHVAGTGDATVEIFDGNVDNFDARFNGQVDSQGLPKGQLDIDAKGTLTDINIKSFKHNGEAGNIVASGRLNINRGIKWDIKANTDKFNIGFFNTATQGLVSGDLITTGEWQDNIKRDGVLKAFDVKFNGNLETPELPKGTLVIDAGGDAQIINLRKLSHTGTAGNLLATGTLDVSKGIAWNINAVMDKFNVGYFLKNTPSSITGRIETLGNWTDSVQSIDINEMALKGQLKGKPIIASGQAYTILHLPKDMQTYLSILQGADTNAKVASVNSVIEKLDVNNLRMQWAENQIIANGNAQNMQAKININNLSGLSDSLSGKVVGAMTLVQSKSKSLPTLYVDLLGEQVDMFGMQLSRGSIKGKIVDLAKSPSNFVIAADGLAVADYNFINLQATFEGTEVAHSFTIKADTLSANTDIQLKAAIKGGFDRRTNRWRGIVGNGELASQYVALKQNQPAQLLLSLDNNNPKIEIAAHCWLTTNHTGKLCLRDDFIASANKGQIDFVVEDIDTTLFAPFLPNDLSWQATLNGKAVVGWEKGQKPSVNATMYSDNGKVGMTQDEGASTVNLPYKRVSVIVKSFPEGLKIRTDINSGRGARGYADIVVDPYQDKYPISGALVLNEFNLSIVKPFFPGMRKLSGNITMAGGVGGTLSSPVFYGNANLKNANVAMLDVPVDLTNINAQIRIRGQSAAVDGSFMSGEGTGDINGTVEWSQDLQAKLRVKGERLVVTQPPLLFAEISPDFNILLKPQEKYINVTGAVSVPTATIRPPSSDEEVITKSDDVVVLNRDDIGNIDQVLALSKPWSINADIGVDLGNNVNFRGFGAVLPLAGAINVTQSGSSDMNAVGVVQVSRRSNIDAFGQSLELNYAQLRFNGNVANPLLSIEADKEIEGSVVGIRVKGNMSDPNIIVFNNAGLSQQQAMNALVTGRISNQGATQISEEGFKSEVTNNLAAAGLSLGLSGTRSLTNSIGQAFGLQRLTVDASGSEDDTRVNVTGYITPDLYIRYGVGVFNADSSLSLRYQLTNRIYLEATSAAEKAIDVVYSFKF